MSFIVELFLEWHRDIVEQLLKTLDRKDCIKDFNLQVNSCLFTLNEAPAPADIGGGEEDVL